MPDREQAAALEAAPRVLVVEDEATSRLVLARQLARLGIAATVIGDGAQAVEAVRRDRFDAVLMDRHLPGLDGLEATRRIRRVLGGDDPPVIAMTAEALLDLRRECLDAGMDDYLVKPVELASLRETLWRWLPSPDNPGPRLDLRALAGVREELDDEELFGELVATFLEELPRRWAMLSAAAATGDAERLAAVAHQLGGGAAQVGATRLAALCRRLEVLGEVPPPTTLAAVETECLALPALLERARA
jgi:CheY-like chemotaxis protein